MKYTYKYFCPAQGQSIEDAIEFESNASPLECNYDDIATEAAEYAWYENDGWEWLRDGAILRIAQGAKILGDFEITVETVPQFCAEYIP